MAKRKTSSKSEGESHTLGNSVALLFVEMLQEKKDAA